MSISQFPEPIEPRPGSLAWLFSIFLKGFKKSYVEDLMLRIKENENKNIRSIEDLSKVYPDVQYKVVELARSKFKEERNGFDTCYTESCSKEFMNFETGIKLVQVIIDQVKLSGFITNEIVQSLLKTFSSAVGTGDNLNITSYHDSTKSIEIYRFKEIQEESQISPSLQLIYVFFKVSAKKSSRIIYDVSNTEIESTIKVKTFVNLQALYDWAAGL